MDNHVHLLIEEGSEDISKAMKRIGVSFAWYYNWKYNSIGHVFQDQYKSEKVEDDDYLLTVIRYIRQNPVKAGLCKKVDEWKWSSVQGYHGKACYPTGLLGSKLVLGLFSENAGEAVKRFKKFNEAENEDQCLDENERVGLTDKEAEAEIRKVISENDIAGIKSLPKEQRNRIIREIKKIEGLSQRQAARILVISPNYFFKA